MDQDDLDTINDSLLANIQKPANASVDGTSASQHSLKDQIAAAAFVAGQVASSKPHFGLRFTTLVPPGCG